VTHAVSTARRAAPMSRLPASTRNRREGCCCGGWRTGVKAHTAVAVCTLPRRCLLLLAAATVPLLLRQERCLQRKHSRVCSAGTGDIALLRGARFCENTFRKSEHVALSAEAMTSVAPPAPEAVVDVRAAAELRRRRVLEASEERLRRITSRIPRNTDDPAKPLATGGSGGATHTDGASLLARPPPVLCVSSCVHVAVGSQS